jgi:thymidylate synthase
VNEFYSLNEAWDFCCDHILENGNHVESRVGGSWEITDYSFKIMRSEMNNGVFLLDSRRNASPYYAMGELIWYLSGSNRIDHIEHYSAKYPYFSDDGTTAHGAYGFRARYNHRYLTTESFILDLVDQLKSRKNDRRCFVSLWNSELDFGSNSKDIPCTLGWMIKLRDDKLHWHTVMRSNDIWLGMPYDIWCFSQIQEIIANCCDVGVGDYTHTVGSLHIYDRNEPAIQERRNAVQYYESEGMNDMLLDDVVQLVQAEESIRLNKSHVSNWAPISEFASDAIQLIHEWSTKDFSESIMCCDSLKRARRMYLDAQKNSNT